MTATGYYWVHGPIMFDIGPILLLSAVVVRLSRDPEPERRWVALGGSAAVLAVWVVARDCLRRRADRGLLALRRDTEPGSSWRSAPPPGPP